MLSYTYRGRRSQSAARKCRPESSRSPPLQLRRHIAAQYHSEILVWIQSGAAEQRMPAVCWLPPKGRRAHHLALEIGEGFDSGRLTSQKTGRRKLTANTLTGAPRGIARIALPTEPTHEPRRRRRRRSPRSRAPAPAADRALPRGRSRAPGRRTNRSTRCCGSNR